MADFYEGSSMHPPIPRQSTDSALVHAFGPVPNPPTSVPLRNYQPQSVFDARPIISLEINGRRFISVKDLLQTNDAEIFNCCTNNYDGGERPSLRILWPIPAVGGRYNEYSRQIWMKKQVEGSALWRASFALLLVKSRNFTTEMNPHPTVTNAGSWDQLTLTSTDLCCSGSCKLAGAALRLFWEYESCDNYWVRSTASRLTSV